MGSIVRSYPCVWPATAYFMKAQNNFRPCQHLFRASLDTARTFVTHAVGPVVVPGMRADSLEVAKQLPHLAKVNARLKQNGILRVSLCFPDNESLYLQELVRGLHHHYGHCLPIRHSASRGWLWDVRPNPKSFQTPEHQARSETMESFPWHTDCSYEQQTPRYFALQVIQNDRFGGGTLSVMNVERLVGALPQSARDALSQPEFEISIPPEFIKDPSRKSIVGSVLSAVKGERVQRGTNDAVRFRFRDDILTPLTARAAAGLAELRQALHLAATPQSDASNLILHLSSTQDMPTGTVLIVDNTRWLHARNEIADPGRHLRRIRWDAVEF
ncbi:hypothetical protein QQS21_005981 [Conoideocrella luteorostrata]|uniref:TauD/TfdA-like domain-containing protein n=1 Tax=Conoideocrella luteorostrata TaxID=1105319 RepID=A0AAJ0FTX7_9HYPO|nr:hypothetical protein QQS21_005981 [Conoideocrella luteorostrata]